MKTWAILLIVIGSGLAAFGISGFKGVFDGHEVWENMYMYSGSFGWSLNNQIEIVCGAVSLALGVILYKNSK